jgi:hypothetical protein
MPIDKSLLSFLEPMPIDKSLLSSLEPMPIAKPRFIASDVASLLDRNQFKSKNETILKILTSMPKYSQIISKIKKMTGSKTEKEIKGKYRLK